MTSPTITLARQRASKHGWDARLVKSEVDARAVLDAGCFYDPASANRVVNFFGNVLRHADTSTGRIGPFQLLEWQDDKLIRPLFGWKRQDGTRRYRRAGVWVPKKNGKSTLAAGLELYFLVADNEPSAEIYSAANDRSQAGIIHGQAVDMIVRSPVLNKRIGKAGIIRSTKTIYDAKSGSVFRALSADAPTKEGLNIHALIVDEIHAMKNRVLWDTLIYGGASRRQPLVLSISTAGVYDIGTIGWEQYKYAKDIQTGVKDDDWSFFGLIYEADKDDDWTSPAIWAKANPSYGKTVKIDALAEECTEAKAEPRKQNSFRRYRLNQWVQQATRWIPLDKWDANHKHPVSREELLGALAYGGLDIGAVSDITAFAMLCECPHEEGAWDVLPRFWVPEGSLDDPYNTNAVLYRQWSDQGLLTITPGPSTDDSFVEQEIIEDAKHFNLKVVGIDQLFQGRSVQNNLIDEGVDTVTIGQGPRAQGPLMKEFERLWLAGKIHHGGHPILRWMADNVEVKQDGYGNLKITKPNSKNDPRKVDGIQAIVNALEPISRQDNAVQPEPILEFLGG